MRFYSDTSFHVFIKEDINLFALFEFLKIEWSMRDDQKIRDINRERRFHPNINILDLYISLEFDIYDDVDFLFKHDKDGSWKFSLYLSCEHPDRAPMLVALVMCIAKYVHEKLGATVFVYNETNNLNFYLYQKEIILEHSFKELLFSYPFLEQTNIEVLYQDFAYQNLENSNNCDYTVYIPCDAPIHIIHMYYMDKGNRLKFFKFENTLFRNGPINILANQFKDIDNTDAYMVSFDFFASSEWKDTVLLEIFALCFYLVSDSITGEFIVCQENKNVIFKFKDNKIFINKDWESYFLKFPFHMTDYKFDDLS